MKVVSYDLFDELANQATLCLEHLETIVDVLTDHPSYVCSAEHQDQMNKFWSVFHAITRDGRAQIDHVWQKMITEKKASETDTASTDSEA